MVADTELHEPVDDDLRLVPRVVMERRPVPVGARVVGDLEVSLARGSKPDGVVGVFHALGILAAEHDRMKVEPGHCLSVDRAIRTGNAFDGNPAHANSSTKVPRD